MRRIIQFIKLFFNFKLNLPLDYYANEQIVTEYVKKIDEGVHLDEVNVLNEIQMARQVSNVLVVGSGTGRECKFLCEELKVSVIGLEPQPKMREKSYKNDLVTYISNWEEIDGKKFDIIWVTKYLPSFFTYKERIIFYQKIKNAMKIESQVYLLPDIMPLSFSDTFKFKSVSLYLEHMILRKDFKKGDTLRSNLDTFENDQTRLFFYHYFESVEDFKSELLMMGLKVEKVDENYFRISL